MKKKDLELLIAKAEAYDKLMKSRSDGGKKSSTNMTAEQRSARAKKAVQARIKKYNQKTDKKTPK